MGICPLRSSPGREGGEGGMKYVMFRHSHLRTELVSFFAVIFGESLVHALVARAMLDGYELPPGDRIEAVSAGQVHFLAQGVVCSGRSESTGLSAHPEDGDIIAL